MKGDCGRPMMTAACGVMFAIFALIAPTLGECELPKAWSGNWFQSGVRSLLTINSTWIQTKGHCLDRIGDNKYIVEDKDDKCVRCLFITENHPNVLQYKESYCADHDTYDHPEHLCNDISGDATLFLMFRDSPSGGEEACPFRGAPFTFTYSRGAGVCGVPVSRIDSCIQESKLRIQYQACPDIGGSESAAEELSCLASWKDGSVHYTIGKISRAAISSDEDRYRCFVHERTTRHDGRVVYHVAQSGDASCNGLQSPHEGSKTMTLTTVDAAHTKCHYPRWATDHHSWHSLDHATSYRFSQKNATLRVTSETDAKQETRIVCHSVESNGESEVRLVAHSTRDCDSGYICMVFYRRDGHVIELQRSNVSTQVAEEACSPSVFNPAVTPFSTLITATLKPRHCPHLGRYALTSRPAPRQAAYQAPYRRRREDDGAEGDCGAARYRSLAVGCSTHADHMEFQSACDTQPDAYACHASWESNGTSYVIASPASRHSVGARRYCFVFSRDPDADQTSNEPLALVGLADSCRRDAALETQRGLFHFNLTLTGECQQSTMGAVSFASVLAPSLLFVATLVAALTLAR